MSVQQYQIQLNTLDKDIANLEKKKAEKDKRIAELTKKINAADDAIRKTKSVSTIKAKTTQINNCKKELSKKTTESADFSKKISEKRKKRNEVYLKIQQLELKASKKVEKEIQRTNAEYKKRIQDLQNLVISAQSKNAIQQSSIKEYDFFLSHAHEDKETFVNEFVEELRRIDIKVWYDSDEMILGSSTRQKIDEGLKRSKYGIVVLSPDYIKEGKYWTHKELNGLFSKESVYENVIIPIWHNLSKQEVIDYSPMIADKTAALTALYTPKEMALLFKNFLDQRSNEVTL